MRRFLALLLCLSMILSMAACAGDEAQETATAETQETKEEKEIKPETETKTEEENKEVVYATIEDPLTPEDLAAIPIANSSMTTDELRQICLDFLHLQTSFPWMISEDYSYVVPSQKYPFSFEAGKIYAGVLYVNVASGNVYRWLEYYDSETGIVDFGKSFALNMDLFGSACSGGAGWAWGRVINSADYGWTAAMNVKHGFIPVGDYYYDPAINRYNEDGFGDCSDIAKENGAAVMYASYAKLLPADCLVSNGHVTLCCDKPVVKYNADGTINGRESYITFSDQQMYRDLDYQIRTQSDGTKYSIQGSIDVKRTFEELYNKGFLPHTFAEFLGTDPVEDAVASIGITSDTISVTELVNATFTANYAISDIFYSIKDANGNEVQPYVKRMGSHFIREFSLAKALPAHVLNKYADGQHTIEISAQLSNGSKPVVYTGTLVA